MADAEIFPFLIQVYVENAAKQALMADEKMLISVTVYPEDRDDEKYVNIFISDTGKGFPDEILCKLQNGQNISDNGKHIGIWNCYEAGFSIIMGIRERSISAIVH